MQIVAHRINTIAELKEVPDDYGVEIDLRDRENKIILQHEPFSVGEDFELFLKCYNKKLLILNIKSERIERKVLELLSRYNIQQYFFLDSSFPMIFSLSQEGKKNIALRYSEYEGLDTLRSMRGMVSWVWVDCFSKLPLNSFVYKQIKEMGYEICLVSPELQGRPDEILRYKKQLLDNGVFIDAVCTKLYNAYLWEKI